MKNHEKIKKIHDKSIKFMTNQEQTLNITTNQEKSIKKMNNRGNSRKFKTKPTKQTEQKKQ